MLFVKGKYSSMGFRNQAKMLVYKIINILQKNMNAYVSYLKKDYQEYNDMREAIFVAKDGLQVSIYKNYRYSVKRAWTYFSDLNTLNILNSKNLLTAKETEIFHSFFNTRTLTTSLEEIREFSKTVFDKNRELFISNKSDVLKPELHSILKTIKYFEAEHRGMLSKIKTFSITLPKQKRVLEIGFVSGGYSLFALEKLGFEVSGIDNFYDGIDEGFDTLPNYIKSTIESKVEFNYGDITKKTHFSDKSVDIVYSASVLEHINDIEMAFIEMKRILSDDGLLIHNYNPFFCSNGGHALGIMDMPWGHLLLDDEDFFKYLQEFRQYEYDLAKDWMEHALNKISISQMQKIIIESGFEILMWQEIASPKKHVDLLTQPLMKNIFSKYPHITLSDLITQNVFFVARKVK